MVRRSTGDNPEHDPRWAWWIETDSAYGSPKHAAANPNAIPLVALCGVALGERLDALELLGFPRCPRCSAQVSERGLRTPRDWTMAWWVASDDGASATWHIVQDANAGRLQSLCSAALDAGVRGDSLARSAGGRPCARCVIEADRRGYDLRVG